MVKDGDPWFQKPTMKSANFLFCPEPTYIYFTIKEEDTREPCTISDEVPSLNYKYITIFCTPVPQHAHLAYFFYFSHPCPIKHLESTTYSNQVKNSLQWMSANWTDMPVTSVSALFNSEQVSVELFFFRHCMALPSQELQINPDTRGETGRN